MIQHPSEAERFKPGSYVKKACAIQVMASPRYQNWAEVLLRKKRHFGKSQQRCVCIIDCWCCSTFCWGNY